MIYPALPHCPSADGDPKGRDVGLAYNRFMALLAPEDWAVLIDHDTMVCSRAWFPLLETAIAEHPEAGAFVPVTNRLDRKKSGWQLAADPGPLEMNIERHYEAAEKHRLRYGANAVDVTDVEEEGKGRPFSGFWFAVQKRTWTLIDGAPRGWRTIDWQIHRRIRAAGKRVFLLPGIYVFHWYRLRKDLP